MMRLIDVKVDGSGWVGGWAFLQPERDSEFVLYTKRSRLVSVRLGTWLPSLIAWCPVADSDGDGPSPLCVSCAALEARSVSGRVIGAVVEEVHVQARASHVVCRAHALLPPPSRGCSRRRGVDNIPPWESGTAGAPSPLKKKGVPPPRRPRLD